MYRTVKDTPLSNRKKNGLTDLDRGEQQGFQGLGSKHNVETEEEFVDVRRQV